MNGLNAKAEVFDGRDIGFGFRPSRDSCKGYSLSSDSTSQPDLAAQHIQQDDIWGFFDSHEGQGDPAPAKTGRPGGEPWCVRLVFIEKQDGRRLLQCSQQTLEIAIQASGLDPYTLLASLRDYNGFYSFRGRSGWWNFYLAIASFKLLWSWDPRTTLTRAVLLTSKIDEEQLLESMQLHRALCGGPLFLAWVVVPWTLSDAILQFRDALLEVTVVEAGTAYNPWKHPSDDAPALAGMGPKTLPNLGTLSRKAGWVLGQISFIEAHFSVMRTMLLELERIAEHPAMEGVEQTVRDELASKEAEISRAARLMLAELSACESEIVRAKSRANTQMTVLFNLIAREDTNIAIEIARAAREDSSSMKTVAVMTMAFLPATFFAALFSMPSLQSDDPSVIRPRFWVYLAFTLPTTVLVFGLWQLLRNEGWMTRIGARKAKRKQGVVPRGEESIRATGKKAV